MTAPSTEHELELLAVNVIRGLAMDGPQQANSGHPGTAMALAPLAHVLWTRIMSYDPADPAWFDRDRFVLSAGHASILQYSMLFLTGSGLTLDDLRSFRQLGSLTPGHPEVHHTPGIEVTTGPLGQGVAQAVGLAMAEQRLRHQFGPGLCDHHVFAICGDGDLMEGVSHEAASLAGHLGLGRLVVVYDDNHITIDGPTELAVGDQAAARFAAYGWQVIELGEAANDLDVLEAGLREAMAEAERPSLVVLRSHIGWPSPHRTDSNKAHGDPLGAEEISATKALLGLPDEPFYVPDEVLSYYRSAAIERAAGHAAWSARRASLGAEEAARFEACLAGRPLAGFDAALPRYEEGTKIATRKVVNAALGAAAPYLPSLMVGAADLTGNTGTDLDLTDALSTENRGGRQVHYGIREFAMAAAMNGLALHGGVLPVGGTFFVFSDYCRPAIRLAAMSGAHLLYFFTHDSIGLGEDGPTHQPIEHLASLRAMPGLSLLRPADANETVAAFALAASSRGPTALVLTRQDVPVLPGTAERAAVGVAQGGYVLAGEEEASDLVLVGTGSEVQHCLGARAILAEDGLSARVVSLPSFDRFAATPKAYRDRVFPPGVPRLAVEAASSFGWDRYADATVTIDRFGASAPGAIVMAEFGFTSEHVARRARELLATSEGDRR